MDKFCTFMRKVCKDFLILYTKSTILLCLKFVVTKLYNFKSFTTFILINMICLIKYLNLYWCFVHNHLVIKNSKKRNFNTFFVWQRNIFPRLVGARKKFYRVLSTMINNTGKFQKLNNAACIFSK